MQLFLMTQAKDCHGAGQPWGSHDNTPPHPSASLAQPGWWLTPLGYSPWEPVPELQVKLSPAHQAYYRNKHIQQSPGFQPYPAICMETQAAHDCRWHSWGELIKWFFKSRNLRHVRFFCSLYKHAPDSSQRVGSLLLQMLIPNMLRNKVQGKISISTAVGQNTWIQWQVICWMVASGNKGDLLFTEMLKTWKTSFGTKGQRPHVLP